ncbi:uncharacterized protein LOC112012346 [Quercus suber]|uniref:uncharacterized protein LOC112012346 n=1 Tax=Quercus suber TaxID=58331 RepID=UPI000CE18138|nr:uncharacterized protein LOC112012346 [Quercus suber]POE50610.1 hypothetical protein CFP56_00070 [Quercus suber]
MDGCVCCGEKETSGHTLWNCSIATEVWKESGIKFPSRVSQQEEFIDLIWLMKKYAREVDWELFATTAWGIWKNRNLVKHKGRCKLTKTIARDAANNIKEFCQNNNHNDTNHRTRRQSRPTWFPPKRGWFKININGAMFKKEGQSGVIVVNRNEKGKLMGAMCKKIPFPLGALESEAIAAEEGIALARDLGLGEVVIEGDASIVMSALVNRDQSLSSIKKLVESSRTKLKAFKKWETNHVRRHCNIVAQLLARC